MASLPFRQTPAPAYHATSANEFSGTEAHHRRSLPWKIATTVLAVLAVTAVVTIAVQTVPSQEKENPLEVVDSNLILDIGNPSVQGYTCGINAALPCSPLGGTCKEGQGWRGQSCECASGFSSPYCDWGPSAAPDPLPAYLNTKARSKEDLKRIQLAYDFSNAVYYDLNKPNGIASQLCPRFFQEGSAKGSAMLDELSDQADTHAGASTILARNSPSGQDEVMYGFRGTEFAKGLDEIKSCNFTGCSFRALKTVITDVNVAMQSLSWTAPDGELVELGYVHKGFYRAVSDFLKPLLEQGWYHMKQIYIEKKKSGNTEPIVINVVGHSLGGALANIFASVLAVTEPTATIYLTTFGSPRVGSALWVANLARNPSMKILRVVNGDDIVTLLPTSVGAGQALMHAGRQLTIGFDTVPDKCKANVDLQSTYSLINPTKGVMRECAIQAVEEYHLNYGPNLESYLKGQGLEDADKWCKATADQPMHF